MSDGRAFLSAALASVVIWAALLLAFCHVVKADPIAVMLGTSPAELVPGVGKSMRLISVDNESTTATIAVCFGVGCTPAINTAGSYTIGIGQTRIWSSADTTFYGPVRGIASGAGTPVTVNYQ